MREQDRCCSLCRYYIRDQYINYCDGISMLGVGMNVVVDADCDYQVRLETDPDFYCKGFILAE